MKPVEVARLEARTVARSRALRALIGLVVVTGVAAVALPTVVLDGTLTAERSLVFLVAPLKLVVGLTGLLAGHGAIAGPRSGGQLKLTLGLPVRRSALVLGVFVGRTATVLVGTALGLLAVAGALGAIYGTLPAGALAEFAALLALFAASVTAVGVGLSAACASRGSAAVAAVGAFVLFQFFWAVVPAGVHYLVAGSLPGAVVQPWVVLVERFQPFAAFEAAAAQLLPPAENGVQLSGEGATMAADGSRPVEGRLASEPPAYLDLWAALATLVVWAAVPLATGAALFARADL